MLTIDSEALDRLLADTAQSAAACGFPGLRQLAEGLRRPEADPRVRVAFVGEFSHGKSQVINSLLGDAYLPASATPTTRLLTEVAHGERALASLVTGDDLVETIPLERFAELESANGYRRARVTVPVEWMRDFVIIDTPGLGEPEDVAAELVYGELPRADVIVFVLHAQAALKRTERLFLTEKILRHDRAKVLFLLNQIDHVQPEEVAELESYLRRQLAPLTPHPPVLLRYSALEALRGRLANDAALMDRANYPEVSRALVTDLVAGRRLLRQASVLSRLREALAEALSSLTERRETLRLTLAELDARLERLEHEESRYRSRIDRVCERAAGHLDLIARHLETQLQALRLRIDEELPRLVEGANPRDLRKHLPFYLEHLVKSFLEWQEPALQARLAELYEEIDREIAEAVRETLKEVDLEPGYLAAALQTRPAHYDRLTQASRVLGVSGVIAALMVTVGGALAGLSLAAIMLAVSQALRYFSREKREEAERTQMVEAGNRAMRACLERAREEVSRQMGEYRDSTVAAIRAAADERMEGVIESLQQARAEREAAEAQRGGRGLDWEAAQADLERLSERVHKYEAALART
jgi:ribosome biogenesis GTPase A